MPPVFFFHIPKTGGISVISAARAALGRAQTCGLYDIGLGTADPDAVARRMRRLLDSGLLRRQKLGGGF